MHCRSLLQIKLAATAGDTGGLLESVQTFKTTMPAAGGDETLVCDVSREYQDVCRNSKACNALSGAIEWQIEPLPIRRADAESLHHSRRQEAAKIAPGSRRSSQGRIPQGFGKQLER